MTRGPRRLKDDPDFKWETGCDVGTEGLLVGQYDLPGLRARIVSAAATAPPPADPPVTVGDGVPAVKGIARASRRPVVGLAAGALLFVGAYWLGTRTAPSAAPVPPEPTPITAPAPADEPPAGVAEPVEATSVGAAPSAAGTPDERVARAAPARASAAEPTRAVVDVERSVPPGPVEVPAVPGTADAGEIAAPSVAVASDLPAQQAAFAAAQGALADGRYADAQAGFGALLERWPTGALAVESQVGLLHALWGSKDYAATLAQAEKIQKLPAFSSRSAEITRLRAESLVLLNRCEEALLVAEQLSDRGGADIRKACRTQPKESKP